jgi:protein TIF31
VTQGDEACRKVAGQDLKNQKVLQALNIEGLNTVLTAIVDYSGQRWVGQSVIPGILQPVSLSRVFDDESS